MFRSLLASVLIASAGASRIQVDVGDLKTQSAFGATCDDLQTMFHSRVAAFQASLDTMPEDGMSRVTQARVSMRTFGIIRTLRRARTCTWVIQNDSAELDQARAIVQTLLAGNPCAEAARSELESGLSAETAEVEMASIRHAMSVLVSDSCAPTELPEPENIEIHDGGVDADLIEAEDDLADAIDDMEESESSFIQMKSDTGIFQGIMRAIGVAFLMIFLLLACAGAALVIGFVISIALRILYIEMVGGNGWGSGSVVAFPAFVGGAVVGLAGCTYQMYTQLLPNEYGQ